MSQLFLPRVDPHVATGLFHALPNWMKFGPLLFLSHVVYAVVSSPNKFSNRRRGLA